MGRISLPLLIIQCVTPRIHWYLRDTGRGTEKKLGAMKPSESWELESKKSHASHNGWAVLHFSGTQPKDWRTQKRRGEEKVARPIAIKSII